MARRKILAACAATLLAATCAFVVASADAGDAAQQEIVVRLRSFVAGARAQVVVEPSAAGGRGRLLAAHLPEPASVSPGARTFVVWATGARVVRLGELRRGRDASASF
ncbi:MAG: hypothetical protein ABR563_14815, partial [Pyrinomonadaceae bacterium]